MQSKYREQKTAWREDGGQEHGSQSLNAVILPALYFPSINLYRCDIYAI